MKNVFAVSSATSLATACILLLGCGGSSQPAVPISTSTVATPVAPPVTAVATTPPPASVPPVPPVVPVISTVIVSGTAATGTAIGAGTVTLQCISGLTAAVSTGADGGFSIDARGVTFPCFAMAAYKDSNGNVQKLHSFVSAPGIANITPITELIVASLTTGNPVFAFDNFDPVKVKSFTTAQVKAATDAVKTYLKLLGVDTANLPDDPIGTKFVAKSANTPGDLVDKVLDDVKGKLASAGLTVAGASAAILTGTSPAVAGSSGCTGAVAAFFAKNKGSYLTTTEIYTPTVPTASDTVAGLANGTKTTVVVTENCTVVVGGSILSYKDGSFSLAPDGQVNVVVTAPGFEIFSSYEVFAKGGALVSLGDLRTKAFANFFLK